MVVITYFNNHIETVTFTSHANLASRIRSMKNIRPIGCIVMLNIMLKMALALMLEEIGIKNVNKFAYQYLIIG